MKYLTLVVVLLSFLIVRHPTAEGAPLTGVSEQSDTDYDSAQSWEADYAIPDNVGSSSTLYSRSVDYESFDEFVKNNLSDRVIPVTRDCYDSHMTVAVALTNLHPVVDHGASPAVFLQSDCRFDKQVNSTHLLFNLSYNEFSDQPCRKATQRGSCCKGLRLIRFDIGSAYIFEVPMEIYGRHGVNRSDKLMAYCYVESLKREEHNIAHAAVNIYSSMYDRIPFSKARMPLAPSETAYLEIVTEEDLPDMQNVPVNCWLSPFPVEHWNPNDKAGFLFLENGCPAYDDVLLTGFHRKRFANIGGPRVGFNIAAADVQKQNFLYVHCQYTKCSSIDGADGRGGLPLCPIHDCIKSSPPQYRSSQLSTASSDVILMLTKKPPQEIYMSAAPKAKVGIPSVSSACNQDQIHSENSQPDGKVVLPMWALVFCGFLCFLLGVLFWAAIQCIRNRSRSPRGWSGAIKDRLRETNIGGLGQLKSSNMFMHPQNGQPDVVAQTPIFNRVHLVAGCGRQPPTSHQSNGRPSNDNERCRRQRHLAGGDGIQPQNPAMSLHDFSGEIAGESTIARVAESWDRKAGGRDSID